MVWSDFFHSRTGLQGCVVAGYMRIAFGFLILCDRLLLTIDLDEFLRMLPYGATSKDTELSISLFQLSPDTRWFYWILHILSMMQAILLILGVSPKFQLLCLHVNMVSFHNHNGLIWDGEDVMFRMWNFLLLFLPLDHVTLLDRRPKSVSWPMWPFRLWQIEMCCIYAGAGFGKLANERWRSGTAMYHISHITDFFGGPFTPDIIFNRFGPLFLLTYLSLMLECCSLVLIWPERTRFFTLSAIVLMHVGIDLAMNMHCFEWLSILGWMVFLVKKQKDTTTTLEGQETSSLYQHSKRQLFAVNLFLIVILGIFLVDAAPFHHLQAVAPAGLIPILGTLVQARQRVVDAFIAPVLHPLGLYQGVWDMFQTAPNEVFQYEIVRYRHNDESTLSSSSWLSPDWSQLSWYEKKRWQRLMSLYDHLDVAPVEMLDVFVRYRMDDSDHDDAASLLLHTYTTPDPPTDFKWFEPARQKLDKSTELLHKVNRCADLLDSCNDLSPDRCDDWRYLTFILDNCRRRCAFCTDADDLHVNSRISIRWPQDGSYYDATVTEIRQNPHRFLLDYDIYDFDHERFEWIDIYSLRRRYFVAFLDGLAEEEGPFPPDSKVEL